MEFGFIKKQFDEITTLLTKYVQSQIVLTKLEIIERLSKLGTSILAFIMAVVLLINVVGFIAFAFAYWYGSTYGSMAQGFLIVAGIYLLITLVLVLLRKRLLYKVFFKYFKKFFF